MALPDEREHVFAFLRNIRIRMPLPSGSDYLDAGTGESAGAERDDQKTPGVTAFSYDVAWDGKALEAHLAQFAADALAALTGIEEEMAHLEDIDALTREELVTRHSPPSVAGTSRVGRGFWRISLPISPMKCARRLSFTVHRGPASRRCLPRRPSARRTRPSPHALHRRHAGLHRDPCAAGRPLRGGSLVPMAGMRRPSRPIINRYVNASHSNWRWPPRSARSSSFSTRWISWALWTPRSSSPGYRVCCQRK